jgi:hypothetical protein
VTLYPLGVPHTVVVDDNLIRINSLKEDGKKQNGMAAPGIDKSMWGPLIEKDVAKM